jgi:hypothetical protein
VRYCEKENLHIPVVRDSNAHHAVWASTNCKSRGEALMEFLSSSNLEILNMGNVPTLCNAARQEVLDINLGLIDSLIALMTGRFLWSPPCQIIDIFRSLYGAPFRRP